jgi:hypothetical protein
MADIATFAIAGLLVHLSALVVGCLHTFPARWQQQQVSAFQHWKLCGLKDIENVYNGN